MYHKCCGNLIFQQSSVDAVDNSCKLHSLNQERLEAILLPGESEAWHDEQINATGCKSLLSLVALSRLPGYLPIVIHIWISVLIIYISHQI